MGRRGQDALGSALISLHAVERPDSAYPNGPLGRWSLAFNKIFEVRFPMSDGYDVTTAISRSLGKFNLETKAVEQLGYELFKEPMIHPLHLVGVGGEIMDQLSIDRTRDS